MDMGHITYAWTAHSQMTDKERLHMKNTLMTTAVLAFLGLTGCSKQDYSDPEAFAEKYFRAELEKRYPAKEFLEPMHYKGIRLTNIKRELKQSIFGTIDKISCDFEPIIESGAKYYQIWWAYYKLGIDFGDDNIPSMEYWTTLNYVILEKERKELSAAIRAFSDYKNKPRLVKENNNLGKGTISTVRAKNDKGIYEPVNMGGTVFKIQGCIAGPDIMYHANRVNESGCVVLGSDEGNAALEAYRAKCMELKSLIEEIGASAKVLSDTIYSIRSTKKRAQDSYGFKALSHRRAITDLESKLQRLTTPQENTRRRRNTKSYDPVLKEAKEKELRDALQSRKAQAERDKAAIDARVAFLDAIVDYETGKISKVEPTEDMTEYERYLISQPSLSLAVKGKLDQLNQLLQGEVANEIKAR